MRGRGVVAFAYGVPATIKSNRHIARIAARKALSMDLAPIYTQADIYVEGLPVAVFYVPEEPGNPPPTLRIARGAVQMARSLEIVELWVVAAKPHLWRCLRDMKAAVREAGGVGIVVRVCEEIEQIPENEWFCLDSTQERTQSREAWEKRERIVKLMPFCIYKRVAS